MHLPGWMRPATVWCLPAIAACGLLAVVIAMRTDLWPVRGHNTFSPPLGQAATTDLGRDVPLTVRPTLTFADELDARKIEGLVDRLRQDRPRSMSDVLHVLRLFGRETVCKPPTESGEPIPMLNTILDHRTGLAYFGADNPPLIDTREGVRSRVVFRRDSRWQPERQAHDDQLLAVLAEVGVPLSQPVRTPGGERTVRNILDDTLANFDLTKSEIEWSALSMALYLPPRRSWADRYGKVYTLDAIARELIARLDRPGLSCGGTHLLYSMTVLLRVDEQEPVLTAEVRTQLRNKLRELALALRRSQSSEGSWGSNWLFLAQEKTQPNSPGVLPPSDQVLTTGHHVEWLMLLPADLQPPRECFQVALRWLQVRLEVDDLDTIRQNYCPYSHAGRVLRVLSRPQEGRGGH